MSIIVNNDHNLTQICLYANFICLEVMIRDWLTVRWRTHASGFYPFVFLNFIRIWSTQKNVQDEMDNIWWRRLRELNLKSFKFHVNDDTNHCIVFSFPVSYVYFEFILIVLKQRKEFSAFVRVQSFWTQKMTSYRAEIMRYWI